MESWSTKEKPDPKSSAQAMEAVLNKPGSGEPDSMPDIPADHPDIKRLFGENAGKLNDIERANAITMLKKVGKGWSEDDVREHATNPPGRLRAQGSTVDITAEPDDSPLPKGTK